MTSFRLLVLALTAVSLGSFGCASVHSKPEAKGKKTTEKHVTTASRIGGHNEPSPSAKPARKVKPAKEKPAKETKREKVSEDVVTRGGFR